MLELSPPSTTVFPEASVVLKATVVPLNQKVASCHETRPIGCSKVFGPSYHWTQRAIVHLPPVEVDATTSSFTPSNSLARPTFPATSVVPVIVPSFPCPERSLIFPSEVR